MRNVRITLTSNGQPIAAELWTQGAPLDAKGEPVVLDVEWSGPGGPDYDEFLKNHRRSGVLLSAPTTSPSPATGTSTATSPRWPPPTAPTAGPAPSSVESSDDLVPH